MALPGRTPITTTINKRLCRGGRNQPGDHGAAMFLTGGNWSFCTFWGGWDRGGILQQVGNFDDSAQSHISPTQKSTSNCVGVVGINRGIAWWLHFQLREIRVWGHFGGGIEVAFRDQAGNLMSLPSLTHHLHHNQQATALGWAKSTRASTCI